MGISSMIGKSVGKKLAKTFIQGDQRTSADQLRQFAHNLATDQIPSPKPYLESLIRAARTPEIAAIIRYLRSEQATHLSKWDRAVLIHDAMEKLEVLNIMKHLM